jgi:hypothetical protein
MIFVAVEILDSRILSFLSHRRCKLARSAGKYAPGIEKAHASGRHRARIANSRLRPNVVSYLA